VNRNTVIRPDLMVICGDQPVRHLERPPTLMVEVLSDATRTTDLEAKHSIAAENHVRHYLVVDPERRTVQQAANTGWQRMPATESISVPLDDRCIVTIEPSRLFDS
jgi:Uma2 family endonuclease